MPDDFATRLDRAFQSGRGMLLSDEEVTALYLTLARMSDLERFGTIWNQYGQLSVAQDSEKFEVALDRLERVAFAAEWLDAGLMEYRHDMMRGTIVVFDLIADGTFEERRLTLELIFGESHWWATECVSKPTANDQVWLIPQYGHELGKTLYAACAQQNDRLGRKFYEGVVAKRLGSLYPQRCQRAKTPNADWIKHRFDQ